MGGVTATDHLIVLTTSVLLLTASLGTVAGSGVPEGRSTPPAVDEAGSGGDTVQAVGLQGQEETEVEPNDDRSTAQRISPGEEIVGNNDTAYQRNVDDHDTADWYAIDVERGTAFDVRHSGMYRSVEIFGPDGNRLAIGGPGTPDTFVTGAVAAKSGTYYIRVQPKNDDFYYHFSVATATPDRFEPNGDRSTAASIRPGRWVTANLYEDEQDWYAVEARNGGTLTVTVERSSGACDPEENVRINVLDAQGERVGAAVDNDSSRVSGQKQTIYGCGGGVGKVAVVTVPGTVDGTYYLRVSNIEGRSRLTGPSGFVEYGLTVEVSGGDPDTPTPALPHTLEVRSNGQSRAFYEFSVSGELEPGEHANLVEAEYPDSVDGNTGSGSVAKTGYDTYRFSGEVTELTIDGDATASVDGQPIEESTTTTPTTTTTTRTTAAPPSTTATSTSQRTASAGDGPSSVTRTYAPATAATTTATPADGSGTASTAGEPDVATGTTRDTRGEETGTFGPGLGMLSALAAMSLFAGLLRRRRPP